MTTRHYFSKSLVQKVVHPLSKYVKSTKIRCKSLTITGNKGVWVWRKRLGKYTSIEHPNNMKLKNSQVEWIIREKRKKEMTNMQIAQTMSITIRWVQKLWARYRYSATTNISHPAIMGRPQKGMYGRREHSAILSARAYEHTGAAALQIRIKECTGLNIPHNAIHSILRDENMADKSLKKRKSRKWVRYERKYSNSLWHTDYKLLDDGRWFLCYQDDASRFITGYGVFESPTTQNALAVLDEAIKNHGKPASIMTDHGSQFYANASEVKKKGASEFEKRLVDLGIRQILAGVRHPQTNGKIERLHGEIQRKLPEFEAIMMRKSDPIDLFMRWYNHDRPHMSLDWDNQERPVQAFARKMPPPGEEIVIDEQTGDEYNVK